VKKVLGFIFFVVGPLPGSVLISQADKDRIGQLAINLNAFNEIGSREGTRVARFLLMQLTKIGENDRKIYLHINVS
jgi:hypothetical protein